MKNLFDLTGKYALVVGASSGLGRQFAKALARQGANVAVAARRIEKLTETQKQIEAIGAKCILVPCDVNDEESIRKCAATVKAEFGRIDILCNNAGIIAFGDFLESKVSDWDAVFNTNLRGMYIMSREVGKIMKEQNYGKIINTASIGGHGGAAGAISYYASKGGVVNFTRALACDLAPYNVTVNAIGPGVFETELTADHLENDFSKRQREGIPMKRFGREGELDGVLVYLASDASTYCTGQTIYVDGGQTGVM